jgi:hypothetical protein
MNSEYQSIYRHADSLRHRFRDVVDNGNDAEAQVLYRGLDNLAEDFEKEKNPRSLEQMAKRLAEEFKHANSHPTEFMDPRHLNEFKEQLEEIAHAVRKFSNY